ncbi:pyridoxal phosphate-dependent transferase [Ampelomyces quisqualis]|uniref:Pyridoxal phosphate-dependent transferase n=1 Tax=Ampelomyces quisqualis TaxID=50730 RepID=A0A6A5QYF5_AMPQU|nr:pyridoxal phosphate-dependent transferase [Ampelomyces quisqualis]
MNFGFRRRVVWGDLDRKRVTYNDRVARLRKSEYPMLKNLTYLDHGGTTLASRSLLDSFCAEMKATLLANPHSDASNPSASSKIVAETRMKVLHFFNADPDKFDVIFTTNTTAAVKLVMECFSGLDSGFDYVYHQNCHTSLVGVRENAVSSRCLTSDEDIDEWLDYGTDLLELGEQPTLFAYPAQSNMNGQRLPLTWPHRLRKSGRHSNTYTILDAAALVSTSPLDLGDHAAAADFTVLSFYKIFGFPDLGALIVRKASSHILEHRRYFGGGTTEMTTCFGDDPWVARKEASLHARLEDGTIAIRNILALRCAIDCHRRLFGNMKDISEHTRWLAELLYARLRDLRHFNGARVCHIYKAAGSTFDDASTQGATIALNVKLRDGSWLGPFAVGAMLRKHQIHVRTGSLCNPAGMAIALDLTPTKIRAAFEEGFRCNQQDDVRAGDVLFGMVRVTLGAMSTLQDVENFVSFFEQQIVDGSQKFSLESDEHLSVEKVKAPSCVTPSRHSSLPRELWTRVIGCFALCLSTPRS